MDGASSELPQLPDSAHFSNQPATRVDNPQQGSELNSNESWARDLEKINIGLERIDEKFRQEQFRLDALREQEIIQTIGAELGIEPHKLAILAEGINMSRRGLSGSSRIGKKSNFTAKTGFDTQN